MFMKNQQFQWVGTIFFLLLLDFYKEHVITVATTVDERNPAPIDMDNIPLFKGFHR